MLSAAERPLPYFQRAALVVEDIDRALAVYRDLLGFTLEYVLEDESESFAYEIFGISEDTRIRFGALSSESQQRTLALIEAPGLQAEGARMMRSAVVIHVESVDAVLRGVEALGLKICRPRKAMTPEKGPSRTEAAFYDSDNHVVVLYQLEFPT